MQGPGHEGPLLPREEQQLMEGLLAGDDAAIRALYGRFGRPVYTMGLRLLGVVAITNSALLPLAAIPLGALTLAGFAAGAVLY